jgi:hypothetical protein
VANSLRVGDCEAAASWLCHRQPRGPVLGTCRCHLYRLSGPARPPTSCQHFKLEMPDKFLQLVFALRSLVAFHVGLGVSTTVFLALTKGWAALCSFVGAVYVRESLSCCRPLLFVCYLCAHPLAPPRNPPLKCPASLFFGSAPRVLRGAVPDRAVFFFFGLNCDIRREGSPRTANWEFFNQL